MVADYTKLEDKHFTNKNEFVIIDNVVKQIVTVKVYGINLGNCDDPVVYAAGPLIEWEKSPAGVFVKSKAVELPVWYQYTDPITFSSNIIVLARLYAEDASYYTLKWL